MKQTIDIILQALLGLILVVFGLNKFIGFLSMPPMPEPAGDLMKAFAESGYLMPLIAVTEIVSGALLLIRRWSALALLLLAPVSVNIVAFHLALAPGGIALGAVVFALNLYLLFVYKPKFKPVLAAR